MQALFKKKTQAPCIIDLFHNGNAKFYMSIEITFTLSIFFIFVKSVRLISIANYYGKKVYNGVMKGKWPITVPESAKIEQLHVTLLQFMYTWKIIICQNKNNDRIS
jgi:hypothetical protein